MKWARRQFIKYICETEGLKCQNCRSVIAVGDDFCVINTPSRPYENNCCLCTETRLADKAEKYTSQDRTVP
jgi:hypothetical protein